MEHLLDAAIIALIILVFKILYELFFKDKAAEHEAFLVITNRAKGKIVKALKQYELELLEIVDAKPNIGLHAPIFVYVEWNPDSNQLSTLAKVVFKNRYGKLGESWVDIRRDMLDNIVSVQFSPGLSRFEAATEDLFQ